MPGEYFPAPQLMQSMTEDPPATSRYFPASHATHVLLDQAPATDEYLPSSQRRQTDEDVAL